MQETQDAWSEILLWKHAELGYNWSTRERAPGAGAIKYPDLGEQPEAQLVAGPCNWAAKEKKDSARQTMVATPGGGSSNSYQEKNPVGNPGGETQTICYFPWETTEWVDTQMFK